MTLVMSWRPTKYFKKKILSILSNKKWRDDHDSTPKSEGQYDNFRKKYRLLRSKYPNCNIDASMWFIDDGLTKNRKYYETVAASEQENGISKHIYYGGQIFDELFRRPDVWQEFVRIFPAASRNALKKYLE